MIILETNLRMNSNSFWVSLRLAANVHQLSAVPGFYIRLPGTAADKIIADENKNCSQMLNVELEQMLKDAQLLMLRNVSRHSRKLLLAAVRCLWIPTISSFSCVNTYS